MTTSVTPHNLAKTRLIQQLAQCHLEIKSKLPRKEKSVAFIQASQHALDLFYSNGPQQPMTSARKLIHWSDEMIDRRWQEIERSPSQCSLLLEALEKASLGFSVLDQSFRGIMTLFPSDWPNDVETVITSLRAYYTQDRVAPLIIGHCGNIGVSIIDSSRIPIELCTPSFYRQRDRLAQALFHKSCASVGQRMNVPGGTKILLLPQENGNVSVIDLGSQEINPVTIQEQLHCSDVGPNDILIFFNPSYLETCSEEELPNIGAHELWHVYMDRQFANLSSAIQLLHASALFQEDEGINNILNPLSHFFIRYHAIQLGEMDFVRRDIQIGQIGREMRFNGYSRDGIVSIPAALTIYVGNMIEYAMVFLAYGDNDGFREAQLWCRREIQREITTGYDDVIQKGDALVEKLLADVLREDACLDDDQKVIIERFKVWIHLLRGEIDSLKKAY